MDYAARWFADYAEVCVNAAVRDETEQAMRAPRHERPRLSANTLRRALPIATDHRSDLSRPRIMPRFRGRHVIGAAVSV